MGRRFWDVAALSDAGVDVVHLHFGFEGLAPGVIEEWLDDLRGAGIALVHTVHDLMNPHLVDQAIFEGQLRSIIESSARLITLTNGAANEITRRFGRSVLVLEHPPIDPACSGPAGVRRSAAFVNLGQLRPNLDLETVGSVAGAVSRTGGMTVHVRRDALLRTSDGRRRELERLAAVEGVRLHVGERLSDLGLLEELRRSRVVLLPYRWGTHSGLLEAALDSGAVPLAARCGHYGDQGAVLYSDRDDAAATAQELSLQHGPMASDRQRRDHRRRAARRRRRGAVAAGAHAGLYRTVARRSW